MVIEIIKFIFYAMIIVLISKYILVVTLRKLAENLNLKPQTVGSIAGIATSIPELLTISISSIKGLLGTSIYNIISSNIINFLQYMISLIIHKNYKILKNKAIKIQLILVILTILIPIVLLGFNIEINIVWIPILLILYILFIQISKRSHKKYFKNEDNELVNAEKYKEEIEKKTNKKTYVYIIYLILSGILLYLVGNELGKVLENLANIFNISQVILGILLGFITSIPELVTFFESQKHYKENIMLGVIEATNNLLTSNILNLFLIQAIGLLVYYIFI